MVTSSGCHTSGATLLPTDGREEAEERLGQHVGRDAEMARVEGDNPQVCGAGELDARGCLELGARTVVGRALDDSVLVGVVQAGAIRAFSGVAGTPFSGVAVAAGSAGSDLPPVGAAGDSSAGG